jgi:hypothetical protein
MAGERKRKLSLFDVVDEANGSDKTKLNGGRRDRFRKNYAGMFLGSVFCFDTALVAGWK